MIYLEDRFFDIHEKLHKKEIFARASLHQRTAYGVSALTMYGISGWMISPFVFDLTNALNDSVALGITGLCFGAIGSILSACAAACHARYKDNRRDKMYLEYNLNKEAARTMLLRNNAMGIIELEVYSEVGKKILAYVREEVAKRERDKKLEED